MRVLPLIAPQLRTLRPVLAQREQYMRWTQVLALGAVASIAATAACGAPASKTAGTSDTSTPKAGREGLGRPDARRQGPGARGPRCQEGRHADDLVLDRPVGHGPQPQFYQDSAAILKLTNRALTTFALIDGKSGARARPRHRPGQGLGRRHGLDLHAQGRPQVRGRHRRSRPRTSPTRSSGPSRRRSCPAARTYQNDFFKGGDTYKGPYKSGDNFAGVSTPDDKTVVIHLRRKFETCRTSSPSRSSRRSPRRRTPSRTTATTRWPPGRTCSRPSPRARSSSW